jgi:HlyD family secretion protein
MEAGVRLADLSRVRSLAVRRIHIVVLAVGLGAVAVALGFFWPFLAPSQVLRLPGVVEIQEVRLSSKIGGRVHMVYIQEGDEVQPEQELVLLEAPELEAQLEQAQARLRSAQADLTRALNGARPQEKEASAAGVEAARTRWLKFKTGYRPEEKDEAQGDLENALAAQKLAEFEMARAERLFAQRSMALDAYDAARSTLQQCQARVRTAQAHVTMMQTGYRQEERDEAEAQWQQAVANHHLLLEGVRWEEKAAAAARVEEARGRVQELRANLAEKVVRAPEKAVVQVLAVRAGDVVPPNQPLVRVLRASDLWVRIYVPETDVGKVYLQQPAAVTVDAYPDRRFSGEVIQVSAESEFTPRNVQSADERRHQVFGVKVRLADPQGVFKAGMAAEVTLPLRP